MQARPLPHKPASATGTGQFPRLLRRTLVLLASPKLTVAIFLLIAAAVLWINEGGNKTLAIAPPLLLLIINLSASIATHGKLRTNLALLIFHLALIAFLVLLLVARLTYLNGQIAINLGNSYDGHLLASEQGPWHINRLRSQRFTNLDFIDEFPADGDGYLTFNRVSWQDQQGATFYAEIGDDTPLVMDGYRFYATRRGFTPRLIWQPDSGTIHSVDIRLGLVEPDGWHAGYEWQAPEGEKLWITLDYQVKHPEPGASLKNLNMKHIDAPVVIRTKSERLLLPLGETLEINGGKLTYSSLNVWMGYQVVYDPAMPWLFGTCLVGIFSLIAFYIRRILGIAEK